MLGFLTSLKGDVIIIVLTSSHTYIYVHKVENTNTVKSMRIHNAVKSYTLEKIWKKYFLQWMSISPKAQLKDKKCK